MVELGRRGFLVAYSSPDPEVARVVNEATGVERMERLELLEKYGWTLAPAPAGGTA